MDRIDFEGQVAVITGAGQGLGKAYATLLASRGARVVVNDYATAPDGESLAQKTAKEILATGGCAEVSVDNVAGKEGAAELIRAAHEKFKRIDILVHNAGIARNKPLNEMEDQDWQSVLDVHLNGAYYLLKQVLPHMTGQGYGRIVMITSSVGMFGLSGHANYAAAKMGVIGLVRALVPEVENSDVRCNLVSPLAVTNQTVYAISEELHDEFSPEVVAPLVAYLCSKHCTCSNQIFVAGGGYFSRIGFYEGSGVYIDQRALSIEAVAERIDDISDLSKSVHIPSINHAGKKILRGVLRGKSKHGK